MRVLEKEGTEGMMNETLLFDSLSSPIPELRRDLQVIPVSDNGRQLLYFHDSMGYAAPNFALDRQAEPVLSLINGRYSVQQIVRLLNNSVEANDLLEFVQMLDQNRVLNTKHYRLFANRLEKDFEKSGVRKPALAGESYPDDADLLKAYLSELIPAKNADSRTNVKALYAPHIDLRVGEKQYTEAFSHIKNLRPERVVILGTSHYAGYYESQYSAYPFIGSVKEHLIPGRSLGADTEALTKLEESGALTLNDRAHRIEHSIEIHLLFAAHIWQHDFTIVPVLTAGFDELFYHASGDLAGKIQAFTEVLRRLDDGSTFFLISGDLSHVGRKFGDSKPAEEMKNDVEQTDRVFMELAVKNHHSKLLEHMSSGYDATRICGYPPLYTFLKAFPDMKGEQINYHWWDEKERQSAVSFGSIAYSTPSRTGKGQTT
jgi:MEMO1 family protein